MKVRYHTFDTFDEEYDNDKYYSFCHGAALHCGLTIICKPKKMELWGTKRQFIMYYLITLFKCENKISGVKRILSFIFD